MKEYIVQAYDKETIDAFDAQNAPEIVRCKDCKHYFKDDNGHVVVERCELNHESMRSDFFCADAEKEGDE